MGGRFAAGTISAIIRRILRNASMTGARSYPPLEGRAIAYDKKFGETERKQRDRSTFDSASFTIRFSRNRHFRVTCDCPALRGRVGERGGPEFGVRDLPLSRTLRA